MGNVNETNFNKEEWGEVLGPLIDSWKQMSKGVLGII